MPTHNRAKYVPMAIRCFYQQGYPDLELIIVDDGTEPLTIPNDDRIRYIHLTARTTTGAKRNLGAENATSEIIANWDDDDWSHPHRIEDEVRRLHNSRKSVTGYNQTVIYEVTHKKFMLNLGGPPYLASGTSQMYWKQWWKQHQYPNVSFGEDSVFAREARLADQLAIAPVGKMMVALRHGRNTDNYPFPHNGSGHYRALQPHEVPHLFLEAIGQLSPTPQYMQIPHVCNEDCRSNAEVQFGAPTVEYKTTHIPEIHTR